MHNLTAAALVKFSSALKLTQYMLHHNMEERNRVDMTSLMERLEEDCPSIFNLGRPECRPPEEEDAIEENRLSDELKREVKKFHFDLLLNAAQCMLKEQQWQQVLLAAAPHPPLLPHPAVPVRSSCCAIAQKSSTGA